MYTIFVLGTGSVDGVYPCILGCNKLWLVKWDSEFQ